MIEKYKEYYPDGDVNYTPPPWRHIIDDLNYDHKKVSAPDNHRRDSLIKEDEIALKHPNSNATVKLSDDGCIDLFAGPQLGIRIDPNTNSVNIFGDNLNFFGKQVQVKSKANGFVWNGRAFNPQLYYEDDLERGKTLKGARDKWVHTDKEGWHWERQDWEVAPFLPSTNKTRYSEGMIEVLQGLGLPVDDIQ